MDSPKSSETDNGSLHTHVIHSQSMPQLPQLQLTTTDDQHDVIDITTPSTTRKFSFGEEDLTDYHLRKAQEQLDHENTSGEKDEDSPYLDRRDSANTLVEAALEKPEIEERHSGYQDHVAESAAMVDRMLSQRVGPSSVVPTGGGSVLSSLLKLEAQRRQEKDKRDEEKRKRKEKKMVSSKKSLQIKGVPNYRY
jgi:hypothetical protein